MPLRKTVAYDTLCHGGIYHSGVQDERAFVHRGNWNFKNTVSTDLVFHNIWKRIIFYFITYRTLVHLVKGLFAILTRPSLIGLLFATVYKGLLVLLSPRWQMPHQGGKCHHDHKVSHAIDMHIDIFPVYSAVHVFSVAIVEYLLWGW